MASRTAPRRSNRARQPQLPTLRPRPRWRGGPGELFARACDVVVAPVESHVIPRLAEVVVTGLGLLPARATWHGRNAAPARRPSCRTCRRSPRGARRTAARRAPRPRRRSPRRPGSSRARAGSRASRSDRAPDGRERPFAFPATTAQRQAGRGSVRARPPHEACSACASSPRRSGLAELVEGGARDAGFHTRRSWRRCRRAPDLAQAALELHHLGVVHRHMPGKAATVFASQKSLPIGPLAGALEVGNVAAGPDRVAVDRERREGVELAGERRRARLVEQELASATSPARSARCPGAAAADLEVAVPKRRPSSSPSSQLQRLDEVAVAERVELFWSAQYPCSGASSSMSSRRLARLIQPFATEVWRLFFWLWAIQVATNADAGSCPLGGSCGRRARSTLDEVHVAGHIAASRGA